MSHLVNPRLWTASHARRQIAHSNLFADGSFQLSPRMPYQLSQAVWSQPHALFQPAFLPAHPPRGYGQPPEISVLLQEASGRMQEKYASRVNRLIRCPAPSYLYESSVELLIEVRQSSAKQEF